MPESRAISRIASAISSEVTSCTDRSVSALRQLRRRISHELRQEEPRSVIRVTLQLVRGHDVPRWFTYELLSHDSRAMAQLRRADVNDLGAGMATWGEVDAFGCYIAGPAWREGRLETSDIQRWAGSRDRWWRRAALVSTVPLNNTVRGGHGDTRRTFAICDLFRHDRDDMVVKALSWALRELAKKDPRHVEEYVSKHEHELAPRVVREVRNKLVIGLKNPRPRRTSA